MQERHNSIANALQIYLSCTNLIDLGLRNQQSVDHSIVL